MKRLHTTPLLMLALLALALSACVPDPPKLALQVSNNQAATCEGLRASLTFAGGELQVGPVSSGETTEDFIAAPAHTIGKPITIEAWCDTTTSTGYAKLEGTLRELNGKFHLTHITPPGSRSICREDLTESTDPAPCINTGDVI